jgi:hypothetical protein
MNPQPPFDQFKEQWLAEVLERDSATNQSPSTTELGHRFARKIVTQWLDVDDSDLVYCDGCGDGGIDIAYLDRGEHDNGEDTTHGHTWYLVQSKYGKAFQGANTLLQEGQKVIDSLDGKHGRLSSLAEGLLEKLMHFRRQSSERDRIALVFATVEPLTDEQKTMLGDLRAMGRSRLGTAFDVESVSVATIFQRTIEDPPMEEGLRLPITAHLAPSGEGLLVGSINLLDLYTFLKAYRDRTQDLDQLYEKNVRRFLGGKGRINKGIHETLNLHPERFGLYNNGITIVVNEFERKSDDVVDLIEPFVVNGCQTTRSIWEVFHRRLEAGGTGQDAGMDSWKQKASQGVVVTKVVRVGREGEELLGKITRYTNSQNAVKEKDFIALTSDFRTWKKEMEDKYDVFLEIQRGAWDSQLALQKQRPDVKRFTRMCNAFDLLKVYGSGWLGEAGTAFSKNSPFQPNGSIFKRIIGQESTNPDESFGIDDLYASFLLKNAADKLEFGRNAQPSRRQTRFLFYMVFVELVKDLIVRSGLDPTPKAITSSIIKLFHATDANGIDTVIATAIDLIDSYLTAGTENSVFDEPVYKNTYNGDLGAFMGWEQLGKTKDKVPMLKSLLEITKMSMGHKKQGELSTREIVKAIILAPLAQSVPSDAHLGSNAEDQLDDKAQLKADVKVVKAFATLNLTEGALLEILGKNDPTMTSERIKAAMEVAKRSAKKKAMSS